MSFTSTVDLNSIGLPFKVLDFTVQIPRCFFQIGQYIALLPGAADVLHGVAETESQAPRFDNLDGLVGISLTAVVCRMIDLFAHLLSSHARRFFKLGSTHSFMKSRRHSEGSVQPSCRLAREGKAGQLHSHLPST